ncbi:MAG: 4'-phosphopantetheinyl transferase superfamily protein [bacterium]|nr:4'-phosphopantetheinyl transferase superfamily protein [bacterium]
MLPVVTDILYPVIVEIPNETGCLHGRDKVAALSRHARQALAVSAVLSECELGELEKDHRGAPLPHEGTYWSLAHKPDYAAAVCGPIPLGIDIEEIAPRREDLFDYIAGRSEWNLFDEKTWDNFFRVFTAKEAILKVTGDGITKLSRCRVKEIVDDDHLVMDFDGREWLIEHFRMGGHIASVTAMNFKITWTVAGRGSDI